MGSYSIGTRAENGQLTGAQEVTVLEAAVQISRVAYRGDSFGMHLRGVDGYPNVMIYTMYDWVPPDRVSISLRELNRRRGQAPGPQLL